MKKRTQKLIYLLSLFMIFSLNYSYGQINKISGHYAGKGKIIVGGCNQDSLDFNLHIDHNGVTTGKIGNAEIKCGKIKKNHFGPKDFIINAYLSGYVVKSEKIYRESIKITLNLKENNLIGGFNTSGNTFGTIQQMVLSGTNLILIRTQEDINNISLL